MATRKKADPGLSLSWADKTTGRGGVRSRFKSSVRTPGRKRGKDKSTLERLAPLREIVIPQVVPPRRKPNPGNPAALVKARAAVAERGKRDSYAARLNRQLQDVIQEIGNEVVEPVQGWTRLILIIRRLYSDASLGKTAAAELLFERGWGRVPQPVNLDMQAELLGIIVGSGLTMAEAAADPVLGQLIEGHAVDIQSRPADTSLAQEPVGTGAPESRADSGRQDQPESSSSGQ